MDHYASIELQIPGIREASRIRNPYQGIPSVFWHCGCNGRPPAEFGCSVMVLPSSATRNIPMFSKYVKVSFPVWQYLNQPLFRPDAPAVLNPRRFWYFHQVDLLERCLERDCTSKDYRRD